jgi:nucleoid-associated protein YgaU
MGLIDFVREAGESLLDKVRSDDPKAAAEATSKRVHDLGLSVEGFQVAVDGDKATVRGKAASQAEREKAILAVGNTQGIAQVDDQLQVAAPAPESQYHRVVKGDTLSKIAKHYYDDAMKYPQIFEANQPMLNDPDKIYPGQILRIPPQAS